MAAARRFEPHWPSIAVACLAGNLCVQQLASLPGALFAVPLLLAAVVALDGRAAVPLIATLAAFGWTWLAAAERLDGQLPATASGRDFAVVGWVDDLPDAEPARTVFSLRVAAAPSAVPERLRLTWYDPPAPVAAGDALALTVRLRAPRGLANPGGFDYERWLLVAGYGATGYVRAGAATDLPAGGGLMRRLARWRGAVAGRIAGAGLSADAAALIGALALGDRTRFDDDHWRTLRATGTSHLVAISGLHVGLLAGLVFWLTRVICTRCLAQRFADYDLESAAAAAGLAALGYAALAGFALPTQRAVVMVAVALAMLVSRRTVGLLDGLAAALVVVLALNPLAPLGASFWLSFAAVGYLLLIAGRRTVPGDRGGARARFSRMLSGFSRMQWAIALGMVPLAGWWFGELALLSPLVNFVAIPLFSFVLVPLVLLATALATLTGNGILLAAAGWIADGVWHALGVVGHAPWTLVGVPGRPAGHLLLAAAAVAMAMRWHPLPGRRLAALALAPLLLPGSPRIEPGTADVLVLDVGHGLAVLIETAGHRLLFDAGPVSRSGFDAGGEIVLPAIRARGGRPLDMLIVSHGDNDHAGGAREVVSAFPRAAVLVGPDVEGLGARRCVAGQRWRWDGVEFRIVHPAPGFARLGNDSSCVLAVATRTQTLLVTGDIERAAEQALAAAGGIDADAVTVPHHGSATSSTPAFVAAVSPRYALVSAGFGNRWGFPRPEVSRRWAAAGGEVVVTGDVGAIGLRLGVDGLSITSERAGRRRYWHSKLSTAPRESASRAL